MREQTEAYAPLEYDESRLKQFYTRATNSRNLPRRHKPENPDDAALFVDAVIGLYLEKSETTLEYALETSPERNHETKHEQHQRDLARVAFAIDFLQGVPFEELRARPDNDPRVQGEGVLEYAKAVARGGARQVMRVLEVSDDQQPHIVKTEGPSVEKSAMAKSLEILPAYEDLEDRIKGLYEKRRMRSAQAQALLALFNLQTPKVEPEVWGKALYRSRQELYRKLQMVKMNDKLYVDGKFMDCRVEIGVQYIQRITGNPFRRMSGFTLEGLIDTVLISVDELDDRNYAKRHVHSHIAYALEKLYP